MNHDSHHTSLTFLGLVGLLDPPREDVKAALRACRQAGVRVIMITGDQPATARNIARAVGLVATADAEVMSGSAVKSADELSDSERQRILKTQIFALAFTWLQLEVASAVTVSFLTLAFAQLWHVFNMRDRGSGFWRNDITRNAFVWGALELCVGLLLAAVYVPGLALILKVERLDFDGWFLVVAMSLLPWIIGQLLKSRLTETAKSTGLRGAGSAT